MSFLHFRYRDRVGLFAAGALDARETAWMAAHVSECAGCRSEVAELRQISGALEADAAIDRPLPISSEALRTRVLAQIRSGAPAPSSREVWNWKPAFGAIGLVGLGMLAGLLVGRMTPPSDETPLAQMAVVIDRGESTVNDTAFYERLEKSQARADAARYLTEAQDVLMQVASAADCPDSPQDNVDVTREAETSRLLLKRRAALVSGSAETLLAARGVMEEVEGVLQEVADLEQCTRRTEVDAIARRMDRRKLLMKIDLVAQELAAP